MNKQRCFFILFNSLALALLLLLPDTVLPKISKGAPLTQSCLPSPLGESENISDALTVCPGQTISGQVNDIDLDDVYKILLAANQTITIVMNGTGVGGIGDADLYLYPPGTTNVNVDPPIDYSRNSGNSEFIQYTASQAGFWYIDIYDFATGDGGTNYSLTVMVSGGTSAGATVYLPIITRPCPVLGESNNINNAITITSGRMVCGQVNDNDWDDVYRIFTLAGQTLTISMSGTGVGGPGDADLYLYPPGTTNVNTDPFVDSSENLGNSEFIQGVTLVGGFWYIDVYDFADGDGGTNYKLTATLSSASGTVIKTFDISGTNEVRQPRSSKSQE